MCLLSLASLQLLVCFIHHSPSSPFFATSLYEFLFLLRGQIPQTFRLFYRHMGIDTGENEPCSFLIMQFADVIPWCRKSSKRVSLGTTSITLCDQFIMISLSKKKKVVYFHFTSRVKNLNKYRMNCSKNMCGQSWTPEDESK